MPQDEPTQPGGAKTPSVCVAPSPHVLSGGATTRTMMVDVLVGLFPVFVAALVVFRWGAMVQMGVCVLTCVVTEAVLAETMQAVAAGPGGQTTVMVRADERVRYAEVVKILKILQNAGITRMALVTQEE